MKNYFLTHCRAGFKTLLILATFSALAACSSAPPQQAKANAVSAQLGTQWGEGLESNLTSVYAQRRNEKQADEVVTLAYSDAKTLFAQYPQAKRQLNIQMLNGDVEWSIRNENDQPFAILRDRNNGENYQLGGLHGERYTLVFTNLSQRNYEIVTSVDGLDVLNGKPGSIHNSGYVLGAKKTLVIKGFRKSQTEVAAFRFANVDRAYAANTKAGDVRNIGVIGVAAFQLDMIESTPSKQTKAFPADNGFAPAPSY